VSGGAKTLVERIAKGEVLVGPDVAKRLVSQCNAANTTAKQLGEIICERCRRLYLGLDAGDPAQADASLFRLLGLVDVMSQHGTSFAREAVKEINEGVAEELLSLQSSAEHKDAAAPLLRRLGISGGSTDGGAGHVEDLLGNSEPRSSAAPAAETDLLGDCNALTGQGAQEADLLGGVSNAPLGEADLLDTSIGQADLLGGVDEASTSVSPAILAASLDPISTEPARCVTQARTDNDQLLLGGLKLDSTVAAETTSHSVDLATLQLDDVPSSAPASLVLDRGKKKDEDAFGFVGAEMSKAGGGKP
jgi:hypothetical protein